MKNNIKTGRFNGKVGKEVLYDIVQDENLEHFVIVTIDKDKGYKTSWTSGIDTSQLTFANRVLSRDIDYLMDSDYVEDEE
jgi:hypothetical protein